MGRSRGKPGVGGRSDKIIGVSVARRKALRRHIGVVGQQNNSFLSELMVAWADQAFEPQHIGRLDVPVERAPPYCQRWDRARLPKASTKGLISSPPCSQPSPPRVELSSCGATCRITSCRVHCCVYAAALIRQAPLEPQVGAVMPGRGIHD